MKFALQHRQHRESPERIDGRATLSRASDLERLRTEFVAACRDQVEAAQRGGDEDGHPALTRKQITSLRICLSQMEKSVFDQLSSRTTINSEVWDAAANEPGMEPVDADLEAKVKSCQAEINALAENVKKKRKIALENVHVHLLSDDLGSANAAAIDSGENGENNGSAPINVDDSIYQSLQSKLMTLNHTVEALESALPRTMKEAEGELQVARSQARAGPSRVDIAMRKGAPRDSIESKADEEEEESTARISLDGGEIAPMVPMAKTSDIVQETPRSILRKILQ